MRTLFLIAPLALAACTSPQTASDAFFDNMLALCDRTVTGEVVSDQAVDADWIGQVLTVGPVSCSEDVIRMPLAVGSDMSRTWVLGRTGDALIFRHIHVEPDGTPSAVTDYGGPARDGGTAQRQDFPADEQTKANFTENGIAVSNPNVWTLSIDGQALRYALARPATDTAPARDFRAEFPL
ncbi:hypothetical protein ACFFUB_07970 [Algimonas porphyrae]|uniref:Lipoprotein n=1 Tax=Algimonas porphyrae TaxID=1128113 RepID=A0ABQ5V3N7_9PROT|nr:hypothetical protein [Algimonas porphyrae]GLQ20887.1 hypothetical protein GCM10007854_18420 [Algimonas porphyrae]